MSDPTVSTAPVSKPLVIVLSAVLLLAALFFLVVNPRLASEDLSADALPAAVAPPQAAAASATEEPQPDPEAAAPEAFEIYSVRDPFEQLVRPAPTSEASAAPTAGATSATGTAAGTTGTTETSAGSPTPVESGTQTASGGDGTSPFTTVSFAGVADSGGVTTAQVVVDGTSYEVREGEVVTDALQLLAIAGPCGTFQLGAVQFTLCEGESIRP